MLAEDERRPGTLHEFEDGMIQRPIGLFSEDFPPTSGGIAQWALGIAQQLCRHADPVYVYTKKKSVRGSEMHREAPFHLITMAGHDWKKYRSLYSTYYGWRFLSRYPRSTVIATTWGLAQGIVRFKRFYDFKLITIAHGLEVTRQIPVRMLRRMERTLSRSDLCVAVSRFTKDRILQRISIDPARIRVLPNGVDLSRFSPNSDTSDLRAVLGLRSDTKVLMTLARVVERKGHDTVIKSLPRILEAFPDTVYIVAGPGRDWIVRDLKRLVAETGLDRHVLFTGLVPDEDLYRYYNLADVYIMVSRELEAQGDTEGFGITFLEANACEKPVIGSRSGGIPDAIQDGVTGYLVDPLNTQEIVDRVIQLFKNPKLAKQLGQNGRRRIQEELTWEHVTHRLLRWMDDHADG